MHVQPTEAKSWIQTTPGGCGGEPCVRITRHSVSGLVQWRRLGLTDAEILERYPDLTQTDLDAAWKYYDENSFEIDEAIQADEDA